MRGFVSAHEISNNATAAIPPQVRITVVFISVLSFQELITDCLLTKLSDTCMTINCRDRFKHYPKGSALSP